MHLLTDLRDKFDRYLQDNRFTQSPEELYEPNNYFLSLGGKRMRPVLVLLGNYLYQNNMSDALPAALAIEYFHNFSLIHDDMMDEAPLRRGQATVHKKYNDNTAILSGDALLVYAYKYLSQTPEDKLKVVLETFSQTAIEVCEGQQLDMNFEKKENVSEEEYFLMIQLKTSVVLSAGIKIGAIIGNAPADDAEALYQYALHLGVAFQIQDDILDCYGDNSIVGKQLGGDILKNKKTLLLIRALDASLQNKDNSLHQYITHPYLENSKKIEDVLNIYKQYKILESVNTTKEQYIQKAIQFLNKTSLDNDKKDILMQLIDYLVRREF